MGTYELEISWSWSIIDQVITRVHSLYLKLKYHMSHILMARFFQLIICLSSVSVFINGENFIGDYIFWHKSMPNQKSMQQASYSDVRQ